METDSDFGGTWSARVDEGRAPGAVRRAARRLRSIVARGRVEDVRRASGVRAVLLHELGLLAQLFALTGFAIAQPVLDLYGRNPAEFVAADATRSDVVLFGVVVAVGPAVALGSVAAATRALGRRVRSVVHLLLVGLLVGLVVLQLLAASTWSRSVIVGLALAGAGGAAVLVRLLPAARLFLTYAAGAPAVFLALFLFVAPTSSLVFTSSAAAIGPGGKPISVLLVVFDELPTSSLLDADGNIDAGLYPNFARLAGDAIWYRNHSSVASTTLMAVPAILTGRLPEPSGTPPTAGEYPENLFTLLAASHELGVTEPATSLCPRDLCDRTEGGGLREMLASARDSWSARLRRRTSQEITERFLPPAPRTPLQRAADAEEAVLEIGPVGRPGPTGPGRGPRLDFAHIVLPHGDWGLLPSGHAYDAPNDGLFYTAGDYETNVVLRQRHILQLQATDAILGRILDRLAQAGVYDDTLIVVTADHGISFVPDRMARVLNAENAVDVLYTPLLLKLPGRSEARIDDRNALSIDILPTIADVVDADSSWPVDGISLLGAPRDNDGKAVVTKEFDELPSHEGTPPVLDGSSLLAELLASPPAVPEGGDPELRVFRHGEYDGLIGQAVSDLAQGEPSDMTGRLESATPTLDPAGPFVPVYARGHLEGAGARPFALAVNGRIGAWVRADDDWEGWADWGIENDTNFWAIVPESLLRPGTNRFEVYELTGGGSSPVLHRVASE